ncbi:hypothetical protein AC578_8169 [Pseudocercospora eumusae]|uniref:Uncharacterized protein n=1 Tax=Pseudocercospora eumusae TaxID=321146 RepID=A0A139HAH5_9PEZI|nr:hypothetical protein AC578_8169 [Pseudocercospora eumusae]
MPFTLGWDLFVDAYTKFRWQMEEVKPELFSDYFGFNTLLLDLTRQQYVPLTIAQCFSGLSSLINIVKPLLQV